MHISALAFESVFAASIVFLNLAIGAAYVTAAKRRPSYTWWLAFGFLGLAIYFGMLTITTGSSPVVERTQLAIPIRIVLLVDLAVMSAWGICLVGDLVRRSKPNHTLRLAVLILMALLLGG